MITRNRSTLISALNKMALKDFHTPTEREKAYELLSTMEENNAKDAGPKRTRKRKVESVSLAGKAGEGLRKTERDSIEPDLAL